MRIVLLSSKQKIIKIASILLIIIVITISPMFIKSNVIPVSVSEDEVAQTLLNMFVNRDKAALENNPESIKDLFDTDRKIGRWAYEHEKKRTEYLRNWSILRNTKFTLIESDIIIQRIRPKSESIWVDFLHSGKFSYIYNDNTNEVISFGIGTRRAIELVKADGKWIIRREWYLDPFEDELELPSELKDSIANENSGIINDITVFSEAEVAVTNSNKKYDRQKALEYADMYCGATFGSGNNYKYNKKYRDYTFLGGDCANFGSQILTYGGLKMDKTWFYSFKSNNQGGGTRTWLKAADLRNYILYSGKGKLIMNGTLNQVMSPSKKYSNGAYRQLKIGDIICYDHEKSSHISIVTGFDPKGLPLVNSHSTDRYRVPWDMGWTGANTKYWLIQIRE